MVAIAEFIFLLYSLPRSVLMMPQHQYNAEPHNCTIPCGPGTSCCPSGYFCNDRRGIPACETYADPFISSFTGAPCADPYFRDCSKVGIMGYCCSIGTVCFTNGVDHVVTCVDAYGTTASSHPSATQGIVPSASPVAPNNPNILYSPPGAWSNPSTMPSCTSGGSLQTTSAIGATITYNYTGLSIMIHTVTSPQGGVFAVVVDGVNTTDVIDTFSDSNTQLPLCYPVQFPPFHTPPPNLGPQNNHTLTLIHIGPSPHAPNRTSSSSVQFDSFAIPKFETSPASSVAWRKDELSNAAITLILMSFVHGIVGFLA